MKTLFKLRAEIDGQTSLLIQSVGIILLLFTWFAISSSGLVSNALLPTPYQTLITLPDLHFKDALVRNLIYSGYLNGIGYVEAVFICLPLGFIIGLFPIFKYLFNQPVDSIRFLPLTAVTGVFIAWFGIEDAMKVQFLAFGIMVYLLPVVVQRIYEVPKVYEHTAFTLGASTLQMIWTVFLPGVFSKLFDDIRVLVAISWSYVIVAEMLNKTGGVGGMLATSTRMGRMDKVFALLFIIMIVGFIQDKLFAWLDKVLFPFKHV